MTKRFSKIALTLILGACLSSITQAQAAPSGKGTAKAATPSWATKIKVPHRSWLPQERPNKILLCVHGLGFSSASFDEFGRTMASYGIGVYAVDVRGFGQWINKREGNEIDFEACLLDIEGALKNLHKAYPGVPVYLVGESMGGAIALRATSRYPDLVNGLISSVPSSERYANLSATLKIGVKYLEDKDKPVDVTPVIVERATQNPKLQQKMAAEKTNRMEITPKELKAFNTFMKGNYDAAALIEKTPVLMLAGFKDKLVKPEGTIELFNAVTNTEKMLFVVGDGEHLLLEENQLTDQLTQLLLVWIRKPISQ